MLLRTFFEWKLALFNMYCQNLALLSHAKAVHDLDISMGHVLTMIIIFSRDVRDRYLSLCVKREGRRAICFFYSGECWAGPVVSILYIADGRPLAPCFWKRSAHWSPRTGLWTLCLSLVCFPGLEDSLFCHRKLTEVGVQP